MSKLFDDDGTLRSIYSLEHVVNESNSRMSLRVPSDIIPYLYFRFQGTKYKFSDALDKLAKNNQNKVEIFPGFFFEIVREKTIWNKLIYTFANVENYIIHIENFKDSFEMGSELEEKRKTENYEYKSEPPQEEYLSPQVVEQPRNLGGGKCGGCKLAHFFAIIGLDDGNEWDEYYFFNERHLVKATKGEPFFREVLCKNNGCYSIYKSIVENGYDKAICGNERILVEYRQGKYSVSEGKHRICVMKRFGYNDLIPMMVTRTTEKEINSNSLDRSDYSTVYGNMNKLLDSCYKQYERLGISENDVRRNLRKVDATVLDYLKCSKYTYEEMYEKCLTDIMFQG